MTRKTLCLRLALRTFWITSLATAFTAVALGEEISPQNQEMIAPEQSRTINDSKFLSDGNPVQIDRLGIRITPPQGWEVLTAHPTLSLVLQEPAPETIEYDKAIFQRNITVAAVNHPSPIDEARAKTLRDELTATMEKQGVIKNFQIIEDRFFDYRGKNDGLLVFATFETGDFKMMQMHMLVSGSERQFLLTYNDLQERFSKSEDYAKAWATMTSLEVTGQPPLRYRDLAIGGGTGAGLLLLLFIVSRMRKRRERNMYMADADRIYSDDDNFDLELGSAGMGAHKGSDMPNTQSAVWNLCDESVQLQATGTGSFSHFI